MILEIPEIFGVSIEVYFILAVFAIALFYSWKWIFKKFIPTEKRVITASITAAIISAPIIYVVIIFSWIFYISYYPSRDFNKIEWQRNEEKRYEYSEDIIESKILIGKTKEEVKDLLGDGVTEDDNFLRYYLGTRPELFNIDPDFLEVIFENGKVVEVKQKTS